MDRGQNSKGEGVFAKEINVADKGGLEGPGIVEVAHIAHLRAPVILLLFLTIVILRSIHKRTFTKSTAIVNLA